MASALYPGADLLLPVDLPSSGILLSVHTTSTRGPPRSKTRHHNTIMVLTALSAMPLTSSVGNGVAACVLGLSSASVTIASTHPAAAGCSYLVATVASYCLRRGALHKSQDGSPLGAAEVLRRHLQYEPEWHLPHSSPITGRLLHLAHVAAWLLLFQPIYPLLECALFPCDMAAFWFYYPRANGCGLVIDSCARRRAGKRGNAAQCFRLDWHRFDLNVGKAYPPPHNGRHPPSLSFNLPHIDLPQNSVRHWPWRQHTDSLVMPFLRQPIPTPAEQAAEQEQRSRAKK